MINLEELVEQVLAIDNSKSRSDVMLDLKHTKSVEETINRIFDGEFLEGVQRKSSPLPVAAKTCNDAMIILDSDEEEENKDSDLDLPGIPEYQPSPPRPQRKIVFFEDEMNNLLFLPKDKAAASKYTFESDDHLSESSRENDDKLDPFNKSKKKDIFDNLDLPSLPSEKNKRVIEQVDTLDLLEDLTSTPKSKKHSLDRENPFDTLSPKLNNKKRYTFENDDEDVLSLKSTTRKSSDFSDDFSLKSSNTKKSKPLDDYGDPFLLDPFDSSPPPALPAESSKKKGKTKSYSPVPSDSNSVSLIDSDSEGSLPSMDNLFDQMLSQKPKRKVIEIDDVPDRKGKKRAYEYNISPPISSRPHLETTFLGIDDDSGLLTAKERKKVEAEERKRVQAEERKYAAGEKKLLRAQQQEEKKRAKEQKLLEKEQLIILEKENRIKSNRNEILKEMIVDIHPDFLQTKAGELLKLVLDKKKAQTQLMAPNKYHITWRRICSSEWNPNTMTFVPFSPSKIIKEPYVLVYVDIYEFVGRVKADTVDAYIDEIQGAAGRNIQVMLLVEGLDAYYKKKQLLQRRQFENEVRSTIELSSQTTTSRRKNKMAEIENGPDREQVEESINYLQFMRDVMFVITKNDEDTASWIESLTTDLALGRYKTKNVNNAYKVGKCGSDPIDNFHKMLQEIQLCTPAIASSVMSEYPTLQSLHKTYERKSKMEGELLLADLDVERNALQARDRKVNRHMSKKIYTIFNCDDPDQFIY